MREIKFEFVVDDEVWTQEELHEDPDFNLQFHVDGFKLFCYVEDGFAGSYRGVEIKIRQYTGLKDTNGVEVYEGDLYLVDGYGLAKVIIAPYHGVSFEGVLSDWCGVVTLSCVIQMSLDYDRKGNIHQNTELLENASQPDN